MKTKDSYDAHRYGTQVVGWSHRLPVQVTVGWEGPRLRPNGLGLNEVIIRPVVRRPNWVINHFPLSTSGWGAEDEE